MSRDDRFITDEELRELGVSEIDIDRLNRHPATQKPDGKDARDREAVEDFLWSEDAMRRSGK